MKTIVQVVQHLKPGGIETMALDLHRLSSKNQRSFIISLEGNQETTIDLWPRLKPYQDQFIFLGKSAGLQPALIWRLRQWLKKLSTDCVHTHHIGPLIYAGLAARLAGIKTLIHTEHDAWHLNQSRRQKVQRAALRLTKPCLIADSHAVAMGLKHHFGHHPHHVIHNGIDVNRFKPGNKKTARQQLKLPQTVPLIGCSGRLEQVKGQHLLLEALSTLPQTIHLALAGIGSMEQSLKAQAKKLQISDRVHFLGRIDNMPVFYQSLDIFCLPSLQEGMPLSPLEAQACGIQALITDTGGSVEALCPVTGKKVLPNHVANMANTLEIMLHNPTTKTPRDFVLKQGSVQHMVEAYQQLYLRKPIT